MERYFILIRGGKQLPPQEMGHYLQKWNNWIEQMTKKGHVEAAEPLQRSGMVLSGHVRDLNLGVVGEGNSIVNGYLVLKAADRDEAIVLAKGCPILDIDGSVEIRTVQSVII